MIVVTKGGYDPPRHTTRSRRVRNEVLDYRQSSEYSARKEGYYRVAQDGTETRMGPIDIRFSPLLGDVSLDQFPDNFSFGNNGTETVVPLRKVQHDGLVVIAPTHMRFYIWPYGTVLTPAQLYRVREIFEGSPPGGLEQQVRWDWPCSECDMSDLAYHATHETENQKAPGYPFEPSPIDPRQRDIANRDSLV